MSKQFWGILAVIAIIFGGIVIFSNNKKAEAPSDGASAATNHVKGQGNAGVKLVEYGDFQCSACAAYFPVIEQTVEKYSDQISFQFVHYPLTQIHQNAFAASRTAEAAGLQGKFWEMYQTLYAAENWTQWTNASDPQPLFLQYAQQIGLDTEKFKTDYASSKVNAAVNADIRKGRELGVSSTPTFYLDGNKVVNPPQDLEGWSKLVDAAIEAKKKQ